MPKYTVIQSYTAQDIWKNIQAARAAGLNNAAIYKAVSFTTP